MFSVDHLKRLVKELCANFLGDARSVVNSLPDQQVKSVEGLLKPRCTDISA